MARERFTYRICGLAVATLLLSCREDVSILPNGKVDVPLNTVIRVRYSLPQGVIIDDSYVDSDHFILSESEGIPALPAPSSGGAQSGGNNGEQSAQQKQEPEKKSGD